MKTESYLRIFIALVTMTAIACSDPMDEPQRPVQPKHSVFPTNHGEYHSNVTTWVRLNDGGFMGLVSQTPYTDLSTADVFVVENGKRILVHGQLDPTSVPESQPAHGGFFSATYRNNMLFLNYTGMTTASSPPFPLDVIIVY